MSGGNGWLVAVSVLVLVSVLGAGVADAATPEPVPQGALREAQDHSGATPLTLDEMGPTMNAELTAQGFETAGGYFDILDVTDCPAIIPVMGMCYAMNPAAPYIMPAVQ